MPSRHAILGRTARWKRCGNMARPKKEINKDDFERLLALQCSEEEVVAFFDMKLGGCSKSTLQRWCKRTYKDSFDHIADKKRAIGKISIRRAQMRAAEKGNATILVWLGKQYLDQKDKAEEIKEEYDDNLIEVLNSTAAEVWEDDGTESEEQGV